MNNPRSSLFRKGFFKERPSFGKTKVVMDVYELDNILKDEYFPVLDSLYNGLRDANGLRLVIKSEGIAPPIEFQHALDSEGKSIYEASELRLAVKKGG